MRHTYRLSLEATKSHPKRAILKLLSSSPKSWISFEDDLGTEVASTDENGVRGLFGLAKREGFRCALTVTTEYARDDVLGAAFGNLHVGPATEPELKASLPKDAFDFSTACPRCGLGATRIKSHVLSRPSPKVRGNFYYGSVGSGIVLMRAEIGRKIIEATGQAGCMRQLVTKSGDAIMEWMEPVPSFTMPELSTKSEGVSFSETTTGSNVGEPPAVIPSCPECGRHIWAYDREHPTKLVYSRAAVQQAQDHAVVEMYEPYDCFPTFDPKKKCFRDLYGMPLLLFNRAAMQVMLEYMQTEHIRDSAYFEPVFSE